MSDLLFTNGTKFEWSELDGKTVTLHVVESEGHRLIGAVDQKTKEIFILSYGRIEKSDE